MAEKVSITAGNAKLEVYKDGSSYRIDTLNFRPSEHPEFTKFIVTLRKFLAFIW